MKFCIANTSYWESMGYNPIHWRKSTDETKALCHLEYGEILAKNLEDNPNVQIYDNTDSQFQAILNSAEWTTGGDVDVIEDNSLANRVLQLEKDRITPLEETVMELLTGGI